MTDVVPDPKPAKRKRGGRRLAPVGKRPCQVCGHRGRGRERAHLLRGSHKEDHESLIMVLCGPFGNPDCRVHPRFDAYEEEAVAQVAVAMRPWQRRTIIDRMGRGWYDERFGRHVMEDESPWP